MSVFGIGMVMTALELCYVTSTPAEIRECFGEPDRRWLDAAGREIWLSLKHADTLGFRYVFVIEDGIVIKCHVCLDRLEIEDETSDVEPAGETGITLTPRSDDAWRRQAGDDESIHLLDDLWWIIRVSEPGSGQWYRDLQSTRGVRRHLDAGRVVKIERGLFSCAEEALEAWDPITRLMRGATFIEEQEP